MSVANAIRPSARTWVDANTGRRVRQLTFGLKPSGLSYFRYPRHLPGGLMLANIEEELSTLNPATGEHLLIPGLVGNYLKLHGAGSRLYTVDHDKREVWVAELPGGESKLVCRLPPEAELPSTVADITCDGRTVVLQDHRHYQSEGYPPPNVKDPAVFWRYINRPRRGSISAYDVATGRVTTLVDTEGKVPFHVDAHPADPTLIRFAFDAWEGHNQRVWSIRADASDLRKLRPQAHGELVTHEFWWSDPRFMGYTYQDRRLDHQHEALPWCEYAPAPTRLGIADLFGKEVYLSDPVNHYHTHQYCSHNGQLISGSGTDGHSFVFAARFAWDNPRVNYVPLATIHTPYIPFRGQGVNCDFSADGRWLIFSDEIDGVHQLCAVEVDV